MTRGSPADPRLATQNKRVRLRELTGSGMKCSALRSARYTRGRLAAATAINRVAMHVHRLPALFLEPQIAAIPVYVPRRHDKSLRLVQSPASGFPSDRWKIPATISAAPPADASGWARWPLAIGPNIRPASGTTPLRFLPLCGEYVVLPGQTRHDGGSGAKSSWFPSGLARSSSMMGFARSIGHLHEELENRADTRRRTSRQAIEQLPK